MIGGAPAIHVVFADDAVEQLAAHAAASGWGSVMVVMDANTREAAGEAVTDALGAAGVRACPLVFEERTGLLPGPDQVARVRACLSGPAARGGDTPPVAVGSGVITDIVRHAAHLEDRDFVSVPTAASMDGYASGVAAMQVRGVKVTYPARPPIAIYADPVVVAAAPRELTRAGIGDLLAKASARVDWLAAHELYGESFVAAAAERVLGPLAFAAANVETVLAGEPHAVCGLLEGLIESGMAMAIVGSSRPASGCEHHASHFWDLLAARGLRAHHPHGLQVGYATRFALRLQRFAFGGGVSDVRVPVDAWRLDAAAREWLGEPTADVVEAVDCKRAFAVALGAHWPADAGAWDAARTRIAAGFDVFGDVEMALDRAGIPAGAGWLEIDERTLRATFRYATLLRARYTTVDFLLGQGLLDQALEGALSPLGSG